VSQTLCFSFHSLLHRTGQFCQSFEKDFSKSFSYFLIWKNFRNAKETQKKNVAICDASQNLLYEKIRETYK